ncbi:response regulator transcription factor [Noviherbaspirillum sp. CPCC 100848]|uniref:Response regulator transcription factor n=1 Tax=Noviherbaspirillum album TaxID=3080276 RepID=A0ABU6J3C0_9BURK|nr:response regulator transcription factor [Noviherbaspirillum sp. CPCC 100848]MEC4718018.1 response regulator transcription factor [Noviherbaspirillum sp. CPCC 100848]
MNVLIVDDHALIREGIAMMVRSIRPEAGVWLANTASAGLEIARSQSIDYAFLDLQLPDASGFDALQSMKRRNEMMSVVVVSAQEDRPTVLRALEMGASAFVPKSANSDEIRTVVQNLFDGKVCLPDSVLAPDARASTGAARSLPNEAQWNLTERQKEVLALLVLGLSNKMIARRLDIVESTVKIHVSAILREMKVATRTQALLEVARRGVSLPTF